MESREIFARSTFCPHGFPRLKCIFCSSPAPCMHGVVRNCLQCSLQALDGMFSTTAVLATSKPKVEDPFTVPKGQLTFDAEGTEGGKYHSRKTHWPGGASGVTIGRGYDMKERKKSSIINDLTGAGASKGDAELLANGMGKEGTAAASFVKQADVAKVEISAEAQKALFLAVYDEYVAIVRRISSKEDTVAKYGSVDVDQLHPAILDVAVDLAYRGDYTTKTRVSIQPLLVTNDLEGLCELLSDEDKMTKVWNVPKERFERRRDYLKAALDKARGN
jgi:hypothetical protein